VKINFDKVNKYSDYIVDIFNKAIEMLDPECKDLEVNVAFVTKKEIRQINKEYRDIDRVTDVLSFPCLDADGGIMDMKSLTKDNYVLDINPETGNIQLGDIYICLPVLLSQAKEYNTGIEREVKYLSLHSLLHLFGYDHIEDEDRIRMREMEKKIID